MRVNAFRGCLGVNVSVVLVERGFSEVDALMRRDELTCLTQCVCRVNASCDVVR